MEKPANSSTNNIISVWLTNFLFAGLLIGNIYMGFTQENRYVEGKKYILGGIEVTGLKSYNKQTVVTYTGLRTGQQLAIPGEKLSAVLKKLWNLELFSDINFYITRIEGNTAFLELNIVELPTLSETRILGVRRGKIDDIEKETELKKGKKVTESFIANTKNYLVNKYRKKGYLNTKVAIATQIDSVEANTVKLVVNIDKGEKIKIKKIDVLNNEKIKDKKLRKALKNTKTRVPLRFWKRSKYIEEDFNEDLVRLIDKYKEKGYRDARIIADSVYAINKKRVGINIDVEEGEKYYFGEVDFVGNTVYPDRVLSRILGIEKGDTYNGVLLRKKIQDDSKPDANDLTNLYQNNGYLFSQINPVEISAQNDTIDFEIRIIEGKETFFDRISVIGNDKTNDHVIFREIRTRPGEQYSKDQIIRTIRELGQLGFFDAEQISPEIQNANPDSGTVDVEYSLTEKGSSQIELQGGYGGGGFIGTLGLSFNNFAIKDIFKKDAYKPLPMGDGQSLSLRLQASRSFQTYSLSFSEPWLGGKKPVRLSTSLSHTVQFLFNPVTREADKDSRFLITGLSVGLARRLEWPDDFFTLSQSVSFQHYNLKNYNTRLFTFGDGFSNALAYTIALSRNNTFTNPIFPLGGSDFVVSAKLTPPYSLFNGVDYGDLENQEEFKLRNANGRFLDENNNIVSNFEDAAADQSKIDQERFRFLEFYKIKFKGNWYSALAGKLVLKTGFEMGFLGSYNHDRGLVPFERFFLGGTGLGNFTLDGRENIQLRGYPDRSLSNQDGSVIYNKFSLEMRYPLTLKPAASIYSLLFLEGGAAFDNFRDFNPFDLKRSAGVGLRIFMPAFGLLGIDFGYGFDSIDGTNQNHGWETHFIIGQQF